MSQYKKILIVQTAFIGDVILATALIEKIYHHFPDSRIDFLLRKGNEGLLKDHPYIQNVLIWNKKTKKTANLFKLTRQVRNNKYDLVVNLQRFFSSGIIAGCSGADMVVGFRKNPLSFLFSKTHDHKIGDGTHEVERNLSLVSDFTDSEVTKPKLHLSNAVLEAVIEYQKESYITLAPTSVWYTKQFPREKWIEFIQNTAFEGKIYLLGGPVDQSACEEIRIAAGKDKVENLCGKLGLLESAALMKGAHMNYVNDSAPQHLATAVNAPTCAIFCSTIPAFGFGPLSDHHVIIEIPKELSCRPCGLHGHRTCPEGHFRCAFDIETKTLESAL